MATQQLSSGNYSALTVAKCSSSGIFIASSGNALEHFIPNNGLAAIQAQPNNLGREIKKVNEIYAAQVGYEQCKGPHYTKDCPVKEEGKTLEEAYYT
nr:hypothetical protein [Tanacetum cinerariifolium]